MVYSFVNLYYLFANLYYSRIPIVLPQIYIIKCDTSYLYNVQDIHVRLNKFIYSEIRVYSDFIYTDYMYDCQIKN